MSTAQNGSDDHTPVFDIDTQQFYSIQFWVFLGLIIPSILCSVFVLYHLLRDRALRQALHNHIIILLLIINLFYQLTDMSWFIHYFRSYQSFTPSPTFRMIWGYIDWTLFVLQFTLYAWVTIERHILIFHDHLVSTRRKRIFVHYLPPLTITIHCLLYYALVFWASPCDNTFDNIMIPGSFPCAFTTSSTLSTYDVVVHGILPTFIVVISSAVLLFRAVWQRYHAQRQIRWRQYRKMTLQVLIVSTTYLAFSFPYMCVNFLHLCGMPSDIGSEFLSRATFFTYYTLFLFPITAIGSLSELRNKLKKALPCHQRRHAVAPADENMARPIDKRVVIQEKV